MKYKIKSRVSGEVLYSSDTDSFRLCVEEAVESRVNLSGADLSWVNLSGANLSEAKGINKHICTGLRILLDQPGKIRAYKLVTADGYSPMCVNSRYKAIHYEIGKSYRVANANADETQQCAAGISLATMDWCLREWREGWRILIAEFGAKDIACIPTATDGKFRVKRCKIVGEKKLTDLDWPPKPPKKKS